ETGVEGGEDALPYAEGLNVFAWDRRIKAAAAAAGLYHVAGDEDGVAGHKVGPGGYRVRLSLGDATVEAPLEVRWDPRLETTDDQIVEQQAALGAVRAMIDELHRSLVALDAAKAQAADRKAILEKIDGDATVIEAAEALVEAVDEWRDSVANFKREGFQDVLNFPDRLSTDLQFLYRNIDGATAGMTQGMRDRQADLKARWDTAIAARDALIAGAVAEYDAAFAAAQAAGLVLPPFTEAQADAGEAAKEAREAAKKAREDAKGKEEDKDVADE
ncbi:MAG: hypothetical protein AAGC56_01335, partial [Pseudomonadota bacterium]